MAELELLKKRMLNANPFEDDFKRAPSSVQFEEESKPVQASGNEIVNINNIIQKRVSESIDDEPVDELLVDRLRAFKERRQGKTPSNQLSKTALAEGKLQAKLGGKGSFKDTMSLRRMWAGLPTTKDTQDIVQSFTKIRTARDTPAGNMGLIFNFMKMLDPGSVVRESEFRAAGKAGDLPDKIQSAYDLIISGKKLTVKQRADFFTTAHEIYKGQKESQASIDSQFQGLAGEAGITSKIPVQFFRKGLDSQPKWVRDYNKKERAKELEGEVREGANGKFYQVLDGQVKEVK